MTEIEGGRTSETAIENTPVALLFLSPCVFTNVCVTVCVMTDVVPCCFPAEDRLKVH